MPVWLVECFVNMTIHILGCMVQLVACPTADPGVKSSIPFIEIDHEIISSHIPPSPDSRRVVVSYKQKTHAVLVNHIVELA